MKTPSFFFRIYASVAAAEFLVLGTAHATCNVTFTPGQDLATIVAKNPPGTTFCFEPGTYSRQEIVPKDYDSFIALQPRTAILNGANLLTLFYEEIAAGITYWVAAGPSRPGFVTQDACDSTHPMCNYPEDFFVDDQALLRQASLSAVTASGECYFDYADSKIYFLLAPEDRPSAHRVEVSSTPAAFEGGLNKPPIPPINHITVRGLVVEKYAVPASMGAIGGQNPGTGWIIDNNEARYNHGVGLRGRDQAQITDNYSHHNGQLGVEVSGTCLEKLCFQPQPAHNVLVQGNEIAYNGYAGLAYNFGCGGTTFTGTVGLKVRCNYVHDNLCYGLHTDFNNIHTEYAHNLIVNNQDEGIFHEISYNVTVYENTIKGNGQKGRGWLYGAQILIGHSPDADIYNNKIEVAPGGLGNGIAIIQQFRIDPGWYGPHHSTHNHVHNNSITHLGTVGFDGSGDTYNPFAPADFFIVAANKFDYNSYHVPDTSLRYWVWEGKGPWKPNRWSTFQGYGQELDGTVDTNVVPDRTPPGVPACPGN